MGAKANPGFPVYDMENSLMHAATTVVKPDFSGWATKANLECSDGRTILTDAFKHQDKATVPLVWQHGHDSPENVLGHAVLENRDEGVYTFGYFNKTDKGKNAKALVEHGDITALSIFANKLVERAKKVTHGMIREVSLVMAGANPAALIDNIELAHSDTGDLVTLDDEAVIYTGLTLEHEDQSGTDDSTDDGQSVQDVYDALDETQKNVVHYMIGAALEGAASNNEAAHSGTDPSLPIDNDGQEGTLKMSRNVFESTGGAAKKDDAHVLSHDAVKGIVSDAMRGGSLKEAVEAYALQHGIENIDVLFPDAKAVADRPEFDARRMEWVKSVLNGTKHSPFSRIKSLVADITHEAARAKGYIKGTLKKEEYFGLTKRVTTPSTIYKKQKLDRDDIIDIVDFDVVAWLKGEMRLMLDEELARAVLISDGRAVDDEDKIKDPAGATEGAGIRSILNDHDLYAASVYVDLDATPTQIVDAILMNMRFYKGSGSPTFFTTLPVLTKLLLARDTQGRRLYRTASDLASELTVKDIVTVEVMEEVDDLVGIIVNLMDYTIGSDKGGDVSMFDDFDIDYNQYKYLIETRVSGGLTKIRSALVVKTAAADAVLVDPADPAFNADTGAITITNQTGVVYKRADTNAVVNAAGSPYTVAEGDSLKIYAVPATGYYFADNVDDEWTFEHEA